MFMIMTTLVQRLPRQQLRFRRVQSHLLLLGRVCSVEVCEALGYLLLPVWMCQVA